MSILFKMRACKCLLELIRASFVAMQQHRLIDGLTNMFFCDLHVSQNLQCFGAEKDTFLHTLKQPLSAIKALINTFLRLL